MRWMTIAMLIAVLAGWSGAARAYPSLFGPTGAVALPTADVATGLQLAADWYDTDVEETIPARVLFGLGSGLELGGLFIINDTSDIWGVNAKYRFGLLGMSGWALGGLYLREQDPPERKVTQAYAVYTHDFAMESPTKFRVSVGANWTQLETGVVKEDGIRGFAVADILLADTLMLAAEYQTKRSSFGEVDPVTSVVARLGLGDALGFEVGWTNVDRISGFATSDHQIFAGAVLSFGSDAVGAPVESASTRDSGYDYPYTRY